MLGWLVHSPALVQIHSGLVPMVFNTGLLFALTGTVLLLSGHGGKVAAVRSGVSVAMIALGTATLVELAFSLDLGIDLASLHAWYDYGNTQPGRMAPNTALGFVMFGATVLFSDRIRTRRAAMATIILTFCVIAIGVTGLIGYVLGPDLLFGWARSARMALQTATGIVLAGIGLLRSWSRSDWYVAERYFGVVDKIRVLGAAIVVLATLTTGLTGFVLLQRSLEAQLHSRLTSTAQSRAEWLRATAADARSRSRIAVEASGLPKALRESGGWRRLDADPAVTRAMEALMDMGYRGVALRDASGRMVAGLGTAAEAVPWIAALDASSATSLMWAGETLLRMRQVVAPAGKGVVLALEIDEPMPRLAALLFGTGDIGSTAQITACALRDDALLCFPDSLNPQPFRVPLRRAPALPLPMQRALADEHGVGQAVDYRGRNVVAAMSMLAPGLGFVVKQDTEEAYAPIRRALWRGLPILFGVILIVLAAMHSQLNPLVLGMRRSNARAADAMSRTRAIMDAAGDGIITFDEAGRVDAANGAAHRLFARPEGRLAGHNFFALIAGPGPDTLRDRLRELKSGDAMRKLSMPDLQLEGLRADGSHFPIELTVNVVPVGGRGLYVGVMRDITIRKEMELKLEVLAQYDSLTGLPNRALFMDRVETALVRSRRTREAVGLMFLDLDGFKGINDRYGHKAGDELLKEVARRLRAAVRHSDTVARLAGDEFTIILENLKDPRVDAQHVAAQVVGSMQLPFLIEGNDVSVTASIGLVVHEGTGRDIDVTEFLQRADAEMYAVKRTGKNAFGIRTPSDFMDLA